MGIPVTLLLEDHPFALAYRMVEEGKLDPWDVDIAKLAQAYLEEIRKMELLDLRVPARAIAAASFLLRKQVEILFPEPKRLRERKRSYTLEEIVEEFQKEEGITEEIPAIPPSEPIPKRRYQRRAPKRKESSYPPLHVSKMEDAMEELRALFMRGIVGFMLSHVIRGRNPVPYLMALMVLYQDGIVDIRQEPPYEDMEVIFHHEESDS